MSSSRKKNGGTHRGPRKTQTLRFGGSDWALSVTDIRMDVRAKCAWDGPQCQGGKTRPSNLPAGSTDPDKDA